MNKIWYKKSAKNWREALPIGNGFTGIMVYGSHKKERLCFNDGTLWSGYPKDYNSAESFDNLDKVRNLIFEGKNNEADSLCEDKLKGFYSETFLPLGDILIEFSKTDKSINSRSLNLSTGIHTVLSNGCRSEIFSSYPDKVTVYQMKSDKCFSVKIKAKSKLHHCISTDADGLTLFGNAPDYVAPNYLRTKLFPVKYNEKKGMAFCLCLQVDTDGKIESKKNNIRIVNATQFTIYFATATGFNGFDKMPSTDANTVIKKCKSHLYRVEKNYDELKKRHIDDFSGLYNQQSISFNKDINIPTNELIKAVKNGADEKTICELLYNYGKYMIISGSRKGGQPLNLQGIWNHSVRPPWSSNYTVNINTQMNYWGASRSGLSDCIEPLIQMVSETLHTGRKTAEINYRCRGFACNHNVDIWRKTPPVQGDANYMFEPLCGVWLANEIYAHYKNGFLSDYENKIEEIVTEAAKFASDYLVLHDEKYVVCPSASPENVFVNNGKKCKLDYASA
ncbi:MAG: glycoside hydrolase family 95 protein, partial [Eubacterium sp.]|nr:glycoside hydrolase family 95 protein [Eubacterium sp.]